LLRTSVFAAEGSAILFVVTDSESSNGKNRANLLSILSSHGCENGILASVGCNLTSTDATDSISPASVGFANTRIMEDWAAIVSKLVSVASDDDDDVSAGTTSGASQSHPSSFRIWLVVSFPLSTRIRFLILFLSPNNTSVYPTAAA
jgi:hypothetical protein